MTEVPDGMKVEIRGIKWPGMVTEDSLDGIKEFETWDDDVWVATYPKAGTHWVSEICHLINHDGDLGKVDREQVQTPIEFDKEDKMGVVKSPLIPYYKSAANWKRPRVIVTHVPVRLLPRSILEGGKGKVISVIRNPKDTVVSEFHFYSTFSSLNFAEHFNDSALSDNPMFGTWFANVLGFWAKRHDQQFLILKYEDMKQDTRGAVVKIASFLGRSLSDEVIDKIVDLVSIKSMKKRFHVSKDETEKKPDSENTTTERSGAKNLVRKGVVGDWKNCFTVAQSEAYDALYCEKMKGSGLKLQFE